MVTHWTGTFSAFAYDSEKRFRQAFGRLDAVLSILHFHRAEDGRPVDDQALAGCALLRGQGRLVGELAENRCSVDHHVPAFWDAYPDSTQ